QGIALQWVNVYTYLGIWIDKGLKFDSEINYLRDRMDYATAALNTLSGWQWEKLEVAQNNAIRVIVKAPMSHISPNRERLTACFATKLITRARESDIKNGRALNLNRDVFNMKTWLLCAAKAVNRLESKDTILSKGPDTMSPDYSTPAPWESPPAVINILQTGTRKADCNPHELRQVAERNMKAVTPHNSTVYYTDGSVEPTSTKAGAAFTIEGVIDLILKRHDVRGDRLMIPEKCNNDNNNPGGSLDRQ
ncbi:hypothetical protein Hamer_G020233, partial [Homarus americanus]